MEFCWSGKVGTLLLAKVVSAEPELIVGLIVLPSDYLQHVEKKEADKYRCTICGKEYSNRGKAL